MMVYNRSSDTSSDWVRLSSMKAGTFFYNKRTGRTQYQRPPSFTAAFLTKKND